MDSSGEVCTPTSYQNPPKPSSVLSLEPCPIQLSIKVAEKDKDKMAQAAHERNQGSSPLVDDGTDAQSLPSLKYLPDDQTDGWVTIEEPMLFAYAGQGPFVSR